MISRKSIMMNCRDSKERFFYLIYVGWVWGLKV
jgi:hypothetical protein